MKSDAEHLLPEAGHALSREDFARTAGLAQEEIRELLDYGLLSERTLDLPTALSLREAVRLKSDFDLDLFSTGLLAGCIEQIRELRGEVSRLRASHPVQTVVTEVSFTSVHIRAAP